MPNVRLAIPNYAGWSERPLNELCEVISRGTAPVYVENSATLAIGQRCVTAADFDASKARPHSGRAMAGVLQPQAGDVLLNSTGAGTIGRSCLFNSPGSFVIDGHITVLRPSPTSLNGRWLNAILRSSWGQRHLERYCFSGSTNQVELNRVPLSSTQIPTPPIEEQQGVATILDTLDTTIRQTEAIIEKLKQVKQGLLHDLLTRGIDANGELRPPQSEAPHLYKGSALGWIPRDWEALGLADMASPDRSVLRTGPFGSSLKGEHLTESGRPVVTIGSLGIGRFLANELLYVSEATARVLADFELLPGDIAFSRVADVGRSVVVREAERGWIMSSNFMRISVDSSRVAPEFLQAALAFDVRVKKQIRATVNSAGRDVASSAILMGLRFPAPPYQEQAEFNAHMAVIDQRIKTEERFLMKMQAEQGGLMDDLLTGRVRVTSLLDTTL